MVVEIDEKEFILRVAFLCKCKTGSNHFWAFVRMLPLSSSTSPTVTGESTSAKICHRLRPAVLKYAEIFLFQPCHVRSVAILDRNIQQHALDCGCDCEWIVCAALRDECAGCKACSQSASVKTDNKRLRVIRLSFQQLS